MYLQNHGVKLFVLIQLLGGGQDGGGLACAWGAVEQEMGKLLLVDKPLDWRDGGALEKQKSSYYEALSHKWCSITVKYCWWGNAKQMTGNNNMMQIGEKKKVTLVQVCLCLVWDAFTRCCADRKIWTHQSQNMKFTYFETFQMRDLMFLFTNIPTVRTRMALMRQWQRCTGVQCIGTH